MDRQQHLIGGMTREFFQRLGQHYGEELPWFFEPHSAEKVFRDWRAEKRVQVIYDRPLLRVRKQGTRIVELATRYTAKAFVDATYEGDLLKASGVR